MAARKTQPKKEALLLRSHALTAATQTTLKSLSRDATDYIGTEVSNSAVLRAMIRYVDQQETPWVREHLFPLIEQEIVSGTRWGRRKS